MSLIKSSRHTPCAVTFQKQPLCIIVNPAINYTPMGRHTPCAVTFQKQPLCIIVNPAINYTPMGRHTPCAVTFQKQPLCINTPRCYQSAVFHTSGTELQKQRLKIQVFWFFLPNASFLSKISSLIIEGVNQGHSILPIHFMYANILSL